MSFFMLMFCLSGILLNHRSLIKDVDVSRKYLPSRYEFKNWNGGLLRGTLALDDAILLYGNGGIWQTDSTASTFKDFNKGMPTGADCRQIRNVIRTDDGCGKVKLTARSIILSRNATFPKAKCLLIPDTETMSIGRRRNR